MLLFLPNIFWCIWQNNHDLNRHPSVDQFNDVVDRLIRTKHSKSRRKKKKSIDVRNSMIVTRNKKTLSQQNSSKDTHNKRSLISRRGKFKGEPLNEYSDNSYFSLNKMNCKLSYLYSIVFNIYIVLYK